MSDRISVLRSLPYLSELSDDVLSEVASESEEIEVARGDVVIREGDEGDSAFIVINGELEVTKNVDGRQVVLTTVGQGQVQGELALLEDSLRSASVTALTHATLLRIPAQSFRALLENPAFVLSTLKLVLRRLRESQSFLQQEERMAALGKMAAQLMHELNNPAAALRRSVDALAATNTRMASLVDSGIDIENLQSGEPSGGPPVGALERADREQALAMWLESHGVAEPWQLAPPLADRGWTEVDLEGTFATSPSAAEWLALRFLSAELVGEVQLSASRISELVRVVKEYSFLDQAPVQEVDVAGGIEDTLILLKHKLRGVDVTVDRSPDLTPITAPGRDLNQVWTNLIDNAADAMDGSGSLRITAQPWESGVEVQVFNTGDPIPEATLARIFDPFFTTKEPGKGTGLGLHTVHSIVSKMGGSITVNSDRSGTAFTVRLPSKPG